MKKIILGVLVAVITGLCLVEALPTDVPVVNQTVPVTATATVTETASAEPVIWFPGKLLIRKIKQRRNR